MPTYHDVHYATFHLALPKLVFSGRAELLLQIAEGEEFDALLSDIWSNTAKAINDGKTIPKKLLVDRYNFRVFVEDPVDGWAVVIVLTPTVQAPIEAIMVAIAFDRNLDQSPLYFTCETPVEDGFPYVIGQWGENGSRSNLGPLAEVSIEEMIRFVATYIGANSRRGREVQNRGGKSPRSIPDVDDIINRFETGSAETSSNGSLVGRDRIGNEGRGSLLGASKARVSHADARESISFNCKWSATARDVANEALLNLFRVRNQGGHALVMNAGRAKGLGRKVSSYVQFMWSDDSLLVEIQGDYSYWGMAVPSSCWSAFQAAGMNFPSSGTPNFQKIIGADLPEDEFIEELLPVFDVFQTVIQPSGRITWSTV